MRIKHIIFSLFCVSILLVACTIDLRDREPEYKQSDVPVEDQQEGKEYSSAYICPMHCEGSGSEEAGQCPVCGMDYVENPSTAL